MKNFFTLLLGIICIAVLFVGHSYWNKQIAASSHKTTTQAVEPAKTKADAGKQAKTGKTAAETNRDELLKYTKNWPSSAVDRFQVALKNGKPFKILFVGSPAIGSDTDGVYQLVKDKLVEAFGSNRVKMALMTFKLTSKQFVSADKQADIAAEKADLIIFEPFILTNNGLVLVEDTLKDITTIIDDVEADDPRVGFILQPSYPLYGARIYPTQVDALKKYAKDHGVVYMDHWSAWPKYSDPKLQNYLTANQNAPSEKGVKVWSNYIVKFLLGESES